MSESTSAPVRVRVAMVLSFVLMLLLMCLPGAALADPPPFSPVLEIVKTVDDDTVYPGQTVVYRIEYSNTGTLNTDGVVISDVIAAPLQLVSYDSDPQLTHQADPSLCTHRWNRGSALGVGEMGTLTLTVVINECAPVGGTLTNTAAISSTEIATPVTAIVTMTIRIR